MDALDGNDKSKMMQSQIMISLGSKPRAQKQDGNGRRKKLVLPTPAVPIETAEEMFYSRQKFVVMDFAGPSREKGFWPLTTGNRIAYRVVSAHRTMDDARAAASPTSRILETHMPMLLTANGDMFQPNSKKIQSKIEAMAENYIRWQTANHEVLASRLNHEEIVADPDSTTIENAVRIANMDMDDLMKPPTAGEVVPVEEKKEVSPPKKMKTIRLPRHATNVAVVTHIPSIGDRGLEDYSFPAFSVFAVCDSEDRAIEYARSIQDNYASLRILLVDANEFIFPHKLNNQKVWQDMNQLMEDNSPMKDIFDPQSVKDVMRKAQHEFSGQPLVQSEAKSNAG